MNHLAQDPGPITAKSVASQLFGGVMGASSNLEVASVHLVQILERVPPEQVEELIHNVNSFSYWARWVLWGALALMAVKGFTWLTSEVRVIRER